MTRVCLVTGAASGIGAATASLLRAQGHGVLGVDLRDADIIADLSHDAGRATMIAEATARAGGRLDAVIACAGVLNLGAASLAVNYFGAVATMQGLLPLLVCADAPRAVAVGSVAAYFPSDPALVNLLITGKEATALAGADGEAEIRLYAASKRALTRWCRAAAVSPAWAGAGVLLNVVAPGLVETGMNRETFANPERRAQVAAMMPAPIGRHAQPGEIAALVTFLASPMNSYMTGQVIFCDGGQEALQRAIW